MAVERYRRFSLALAILSLLCWLALVICFRRDPFVDENDHLPVIQGLWHGNWDAAAGLPMPPGYHWIVARALFFTPPTLLLARIVTCLLAVFAIVLFRRAARLWRPDLEGNTLLHFVWQPLLFPLFALVYTETAMILFLVAAIYCQTLRRPTLAAALALASCLIRQTNAAWLPLFALWTIVDWREETRDRWPRISEQLGSAARDLFRRVWLYLFACLAVPCVLLWRGSVLFGNSQDNSPGVNAAQFYVFGLFALGLWAPIWLERLPADLRSAVAYAARRPARAAMAFGLTAVVIALLALNFHNPHPWNLLRGFVRNWALLAMTKWTVARVVGIACALGGAALVFRQVASLRRPLMPAVAWMTSLVFLLPHSLVETRYYILPAVFVNWFTPFSERQARRLTVWYAILTAVICAAVVAKGVIW
jgi:hypothetical protein